MKKALVLMALLLTAAAACAATVNVEFQGFTPQGWWVGYAYWATVDNGPPIAVMCDDWAHGGLPGDTWQANVTDLSTGDLTYLRFNQLPSALTLYQEAGWLLIQTQYTAQNQWTDINYAVWHIFDSAAPLDSNAQAWLTSAQQQALAGFPGVDFSQVTILTPVNQFDANEEGPQEFLTLAGVGPAPPPTPEPGTLLLLGSGLAGLIGRKFLRS